MILLLLDLLCDSSLLKRLATILGSLLTARSILSLLNGGAQGTLVLVEQINSRGPTVLPSE